MTDLADLTIAQASIGLRAQEFSAVDLLDAVERRAAITEAHLHAYLTLDREGSRAAAEAADTALAAGDPRPLLGIPIALKDNMVTKGVETTASSQILAGWKPPYDGTAVRRLKEAGAVIVGKTNLDEFAMGSSTENSAYGPTRNPWNTDTVPGGSSGGSAAAVAVGSAFGAFGSDTGGSIRQPAALTGIVGAKPTYGLVSRYGLIAFASSLDQIGPLARTVPDAAVLLEAVAGWDRMDATSYHGDVPAISRSLDTGVHGVRIGVVTELSGEAFDPQVTAATNATIDRLSDAGADVVEISLPAIEYALSAYYLIAPAECSANLARFDGVRYGLRVDGATAEEMMARTRAEGFGPEVTRRILLGTYALSAGYYDAFYGQAQRSGPSSGTSSRRPTGRSTCSSHRRVRRPPSRSVRRPRIRSRCTSRTSAPSPPISQAIQRSRCQSASTMPASRLDSRSWHPHSGKKSCSGLPPKLSASSISPRDRSSRPRRWWRHDGLGSRHRSRDPCGAPDELEDVLRMSSRLR